MLRAHEEDGESYKAIAERYGWSVDRVRLRCAKASSSRRTAERRLSYGSWRDVPIDESSLSRRIVHCLLNELLRHDGDPWSRQCLTAGQVTDLVDRDGETWLKLIPNMGATSRAELLDWIANCKATGDV